MPSAFRAKEMELRKQLGTAVGRGKCDLSLQYAVEGAEPRELNKPLIDAYVSESSQRPRAKAFRKRTMPCWPWPCGCRTIQQANDDIDEEEWKAISALVSEAVTSSFASAQRRASVEADFNQRIRSIQSLKDAVEPLLQARAAHPRRIQANFNECRTKADWTKTGLSRRCCSAWKSSMSPRNW